MRNNNLSRKAQIIGKDIFAKRKQLRVLLDRVGAGETLDQQDVFLVSFLRVAIIQGKTKLKEMGVDPEMVIDSATATKRKVAGPRPQTKKKAKLKQAKKVSEFSRSAERGTGIYGMGPTLRFWR